ncbi:TonB-dependent receptor plug domain-containing protein [uncultured Muribaculum sp.]|uniref:TonB-dependent receptor plug domain-containing protein n=1 Tax=uncultured Muribaculum sp. TaxID=1918613 RepID=UPI0025990018|nr:TonB-dependent receptor plug domain-containing protein [uncultured Muribaculum sp.]
MKKLGLIVLLVGMALSVNAYTKLEGVVVNEDGKAISKIPMRLNGEIKNKKTNGKGAFSFKKVYEGDTLMVFPADGRVAKIPLRELPKMTIYMGVNALRMEYDGEGTSATIMYEEYKPVAYDPNVLTRDQIRRFETSDIIETLRGRVAGLIIDEDDNGPVARMRGVTSSTNFEPLFIVDGVKYSSLSDVNNAVNIETVDRIEVLKDGSAYGMDGANGAVLITTRRN